VVINIVLNISNNWGEKKTIFSILMSFKITIEFMIEKLDFDSIIIFKNHVNFDRIKGRHEVTFSITRGCSSVSYNPPFGPPTSKHNKRDFLGFVMGPRRSSPCSR
jgi:hypothetical protein